MKKEELMRYILEIEWNMFSEVQNKGGRAECQNDYRTFSIMRLAQMETWSQDVLASYFLDLLEAKEQERNLMTEKYARMMEKTYPKEYESIKKFLPEITEKTKSLAQAVVDIYTIWEKEMSIQYPKLRKQGRNSKLEGNLEGLVSVEYYQYCEMLTYSERTLQLLLERIGEQPKKNLYMEEVLNIVKAYGYHSLDEAEATL